MPPADDILRHGLLEVKKQEALRNLQQMVAIEDSRRAMAREEAEVARDTKWKEHTLYGGSKPAEEEPVVDGGTDDMMVAGDVTIMQQPSEVPPPQVIQQTVAPPEQPWYQKHALPLALAAGIAGYAGSQYLTPEREPTPAYSFDPAQMDVSTPSVQDEGV